MSVYSLEKRFRHALVDPFGVVILDVRVKGAKRERDRGRLLWAAALLRRQELKRWLEFNKRHQPAPQPDDFE